MRRRRRRAERADAARIRDLEIDTGIEVRPKIEHVPVEVEGPDGAVARVWVAREQPSDRET